MSETYHAVVWIDHREARILHFDRANAECQVIHPEHPRLNLHHKANSIGSGNTAEDRAFLGSVAAALSTAQAILITGPSTAKTELVHYIETHVPALKARIVAVETVDHPTDAQLVAHARKAFSRDHEVLPRVS